VKHYYDYDDDLNEVRYDVHYCPFCGSKDTELYQTQVKCERCNAHGPDVSEEQWPMAITLWNNLPRKTGDELEELRRYWSNLMRRIKRAEKKAAAARGEKDRETSREMAQRLAADRKWVAEREAWLRAPIKGNS